MIALNSDIKTLHKPNKINLQTRDCSPTYTWVIPSRDIVFVFAPLFASYVC